VNKEKTIRYYNISNLKQRSGKNMSKKFKICQEVGEGVTIEEEWPSLEAVLLKQQQRKVQGKLKGSLGTDGSTKSVNK
jgi:hypothetical protein